MKVEQTVISAFTAEQVTKLTQLTKGQLERWDRIGFFQPQYAVDERHSAYSRLYSFKDIVGLRTLAILRRIHRVSLSHLQDVAKELSERFGTPTPWAEIKLYVLKRRVVFDDPDTGRQVGAGDGQYVLLQIIEVREELQLAVEQLKRRRESQFGQIEKHRYVAHNAPVVAGTRVRVSSIINFIDAGYSIEQIVQEYPTLTRTDVEAVISLHRADAAA